MVKFGIILILLSVFGFASSAQANTHEIQVQCQCNYTVSYILKVETVFGTYGVPAECVLDDGTLDKSECGIRRAKAEIKAHLACVGIAKTNGAEVEMGNKVDAYVSRCKNWLVEN